MTKAVGGAPQAALVLAGGGITGFLFEIGVLAALEEALAPDSLAEQFDLFVGTSAGSVAAALLANGARPSEIFQAVRDNLDSPFNFRAEHVFGTAAGSLVQSRSCGCFACSTSSVWIRPGSRGCMARHRAMTERGNAGPGRAFVDAGVRTRVFAGRA